MDIKSLHRDVIEANKKKTRWGDTIFCKGCGETHDIHTPFTGHCAIPENFGFITPEMRKRDLFIKKARKTGFTKKQAEFLSVEVV